MSETTDATLTADSPGGPPMTEWNGPLRFLPPPAPSIRSDGTQHFSGITYAAEPGYRPLQLDLWVPSGLSAPPLVVWVHGGAWTMGDRRYLPETLRPDQLFDALLTAGLAVATIDYRHSMEARFPAQLHDAKAAVRYLRAHAAVLGVDTTRIGIWGESAGGHLAALVALTGHRPDLEGDLGVVGPSSRVDAVVDWYGPADLQSIPELAFPPDLAGKLAPVILAHPPDLLLAGVDAATRADASPINHVTADAPPFLLVHGTDDRVVPFDQSLALESALTAAGAPVRVVAVGGADHIFMGCNDIDEIVRLSVDYLIAALAGAGPSPEGRS